LSDEGHIRAEELELYTLGALPEEEAAAFKAHVAGCGECAMKLAQAHGSAALLAFAAKQEKPAGTIKAELMARIRARSESEERLAWPRQSNTQVPIGEQETTKERAKTRRGWNWMLAPPALVLILVSFDLAWQNRKLAAELAKEKQASETVARQAEEIAKLVRVLAAPDTLTVKLAGTGAASNGIGVVKYNARLGLVAYSAELPPPPAGKSYQVWLVPAKGAPISAGLVRTNGRATGSLWSVEVPASTVAKGFVVTIEAADGAAEPRGPKVLAGAS
jgi:anti-sigma-K factor RskA